MANLNKVMLIGNLTRDPISKATLSGTYICEMGIATSRRYRSAQGEDREEVCFVDLEAFGRTAEICAQYLRKGSPVYFEGRLKYDQWVDKNTNQNRSKLKVIVENMQMLNSRSSGQQLSAPDGDTGDYYQPGPTTNPYSQAPGAYQPPPPQQQQQSSSYSRPAYQQPPPAQGYQQQGYQQQPPPTQGYQQPPAAQGYQQPASSGFPPPPRQQSPPATAFPPPPSPYPAPAPTPTAAPTPAVSPAATSPPQPAASPPADQVADNTYEPIPPPGASSASAPAATPTNKPEPGNDQNAPIDDVPF